MVNLGHFVDNGSMLGRLDPRIKIASTVALSILIFRASWMEVYLISLFLLIIIRTARLQFGPMLHAIRPLFLFAVLFFLLHLFFTDGTAPLTLPFLPIRISQEGLYRGAMVAWQFIALVLCGVILTMTTPPSELVSGLEKLLYPLKYLGVPVQEIAVMVSMALRFVPTMLEEFDRIRMAQMARGADFHRSGMLHRAKITAFVAIPLMISAFRRADELAEAMESRGYHRGPRTALRELRIDGRDFAAMGWMLIFIAVLAISRVYVS